MLCKTEALVSGARGGRCDIPWDSNPGAGHMDAMDVCVYERWCVVVVVVIVVVVVAAKVEVEGGGKGGECDL